MKTFSTNDWKIPDNWNIATIGEITSDWRGGASLTPEDFTDEGFPILHKGAIQRNGKILVDTKKKTFASIDYAQSNPNSIVDKSFLAATLRDLVPSGPSIGLIADLAKASRSEFLLAQGAYGFKIDKTRVNPSYLVQLSNFEPFRLYLKRYCVGSTQIHIRTPIFQALQIPLPPLPEQKRIAEVLDKADALREKRRHALQKLDTLLQSVFLEIFGDPVKNPKGWVKNDLKDLCTKITDGVHATPTYIEQGVPFISTVHLTEHGINWATVKYISEEEHSKLIERCHPHVGDILYTKVGSVGTAIPIIEPKPFSIFVQLALLKLNRNKCDCLFLTHLLNMPSLRNSVVSRLSGATMKYIGIGEIGKIQIITPPMESQKKFAAFVASITLLRNVDSTCKCNFLFFEKDPSRCPIVQPLAWPIV